MNPNPFRDKVNPYEAPVVAELSERPRVYQPPRAKKRWPPLVSILWVLGGPFLCLAILRHFYALGYFTLQDDMVYAFFYLTTGVSWLLAMIRVTVWLCRG